MEVKYIPNNEIYKRMNTDELRKSFLFENLFTANEIALVYADVDRAIVGSAVPSNKPLKLEASKKEMAADYFAERREIGVMNVGANGKITADGKEFKMENKDVLYIGMGTKNIDFASDDEKNPAKYYIVSYPAHTSYPTTHAKPSDAEPEKLGSLKDSNKRTIYKYIHPNGIKSCQLVMGFTSLDEGSVWNTMPAHTHQRRSEIYMYFDLLPESVVFHMMGEPNETRNLVIRNQQAVISPSWSIHCGAATQNYTFIWAMGGENQVFADMDGVKMKDLN